jgi:hypothetical protein
VLPSREWKRARFAGKDYREEHRKWYLGDSISRHRQGYNTFTPIQRRTRSPRSPTTASPTARTW